MHSSSQYAMRYISLDTPHFFGNGSIRFPQSSMAMSSSVVSQQNESMVSNDIESTNKNRVNGSSAPQAPTVIVTSNTVIINQSSGLAGDEDGGSELPEIPSASRGKAGENSKITHSKRMASESNFAPVVVELRAAAAHS